MSKRLNGIPNALMRYAMTVFGTVIAAISFCNIAIAEPVLEQSLPPEAASLESVVTSEVASENVMNAALEAAASQIAGIIPAITRPAENERPVVSSAERTREINCLAQAVYFEARGEPERGQLAVAEVVSNRVSSRAYPNTFCGVVHQRTRSVCQFSWVCDSSRGTPNGFQWERAQQIATRVYDGWDPSVVGNATMFHATYVRPSWSRSFSRVGQIGSHIFYSAR